MNFQSKILNNCVKLILLTSISFTSLAQAPQFAWAKSAGGPNQDINYDISVDPSGNSYITGLFYIIAKYDAIGNIVWAHQQGTGFGSGLGSGVAVDASGNSYVTGTFSGSATFGNTTLTASNGDIFIAKYDPNGNVLWAKSAGGDSGEIGRDVSIDGNGNVYITGQFLNIANFGSITLTSFPNQNNAFIAKYDASGNILWAKQASGSGSSDGFGISVDNSGNSFITGDFQGEAGFGNSVLNSNGSNGTDLFLAKYDGAGNFLWALQAGDIGIDRSRDITTDSNGNSYITGVFMSSTITFGNITLTRNWDEGSTYIAKFDGAGNAIWAQKGGGSNNGIDGGIAVDGNGNSYITGIFQGSAPFGNITITGNGNIYFDVFVAKYDASGNSLWAVSCGGGSHDSGFGIAVDGSGNCYIGGYFQTSANFGNIVLTSAGNEDMFIAKLGNNPLNVPSSPTSILSSYPNPFSTSFQISLTGTAPATAILTDMLGRQVHRQVISAESGRATVTIIPPANLPSGVYVLQLLEGGRTRQTKVIRE